MTKQIKNIKIQNIDELKSYITDKTVIIIDFILLLLICGYINNVGLHNFDPFDLIIPLVLRFVITITLYKYDNSIKHQKIEDNENINKFLMIKIIAFMPYLYMIFTLTNEQFLHHLVDESVDFQKIKEFVYSVIVFQIIVFITVFMTVVIIIKNICNTLTKNKKNIIDDINKNLNIIFFISFSFFITSNSFNEIKNLLFGTNIDQDIILKIKELSLYLTIFLIFFVTYARTEDNEIFEYGKKLNTIIILSTIGIIVFHILENIQMNSINHGFIGYIMIIMILTILVINLVTSLNNSKKEKVCHILFKIFFISYICTKGLDIVPEFLVEILLVSLITTFGFLNTSFSKYDIILIKIMIRIVMIALIGELILNYIEELDYHENKSKYISSFGISLFIMGFIKAYEEKEKKEQKVKKNKKIFKSVITLFHFKKIHQSIKDDYVGERVIYKNFIKNIRLINMIYCCLLCGALYVGLNIIFYPISNLSPIITDFVGMYYYIFYVNTITVFILTTITNFWFLLILFITYYIANILFTRILFTNERIIIISPLILQYIDYSYSEISVKNINNKDYIIYYNDKILCLKDNIQKKYIKRKIKESLKQT